MSHESENGGWPREAGDRRSLPTEISPPAELEDRVAGSLLRQGLIRPDQPAVARHPGWRAVRASFALAACVTLVALGVLIGRMSGNDVPTAILDGSATDLYALMLYETDDYDAPTGAEALTRYGEYSEWIADARARGQFVTGEDLEVERGWLLQPTEGGVSVEPSTSVAADAALSGVLFIRANDIDHAIELARELPHLKHGGSVIVQKTIPTDSPPANDE